MTNFKVGQKIVCIDDNFRIFSLFTNINTPQKGKIYTIREISLGNSPEGPSVGILLQEIKNRSNLKTGKEYGFLPRRFRPLEFDGDAIKEILEKFAPVEEKIDTQIPVEAHI